MELALQAPALQGEPLPLEHVQSQVAVYTRRILRIDSRVPVEKQFIQDNTYSAFVSVNRASEALQQQDFDAVLIHPNAIDANIQKLKEQARQAAVPLLILTDVFEQEAKDAAIRIGADDYHYGPVAGPLFKRLEFIKKIKRYKAQRGNSPYTTMSVDEVPQVKLWSLKRAFDIIVSGTALLLLSPLLLLIALIIKLESRGPIFYIAKRAGSGYQIFNFYKFRSMRVGADKELQKLAHMNQYSNNPSSGVFFKIKNDPRITRFGNILRKTSLDEIPQLFNVLIGDMSLVGNRPLPLYEAEKLTKDQIAWRFLAPAGITGLWQITKRGKEDMSEEERIALDMEYAMKNSFWLDLKIMFKTIPALLQKEKV